MKELSYLGSLLGMPDIFDPAFTLAYTAFFGDMPPMPVLLKEEEDDEMMMMMEDGGGKGEETSSKAIHTDNVSTWS